jgi:flavin reductase
MPASETCPSLAQGVEAADYIAAMAKLATGVSIVTTDGSAGRRGLTVSAVTSVSIDAQGPILLICVNDRSGAGAAIVQNGSFCVNMLAAEQAALAERFSRPSEGDRFADIDHTTTAHGTLRLTEAYVAFDCSLMRQDSLGTHRILYGRVVAINHGAGAGPLVYAHRGFCTAVPHKARC